MIELQKVRQKLLENELFIFASDYGKKVNQESWTVRKSKQIKQISDFKEFQNANIITGGQSLIADVDLDCPEGNQLADYFLEPTGIEFGRESTPRSHRLYKVIDLDIKHTRKYYDFKAGDKSMLVEIRANKHYTMCLGQYDNKEKVVYSKCAESAEITWDTLCKNAAMLSVACVILRKYAPSGTRNEYIKLIIATLWLHKFDKQDCEKIIEAVSTVANDEDLTQRLARIENIYKKEFTEQTQGLPTLAEKFNWNENEVKDFKRLLLAVTGRDLAPAWTNTFVKRIAYMMKQKKYYDLEDKEMYDAEAIDVKYARNFPKYTPTFHWKRHKDRKVCVDFTYKPENQSRFVTVDKKLMINIYEPNDLEPDPKADTDIYHALLKQIIPHDECRKHFLDWNSYIVQNKGKKIRHALILQSNAFQLGKGSLFDVQRDILGRVNAKKIELRQALDKGKGYLINSQLVLIDEAKSTGKWEEKQLLINTLKTIISEGSIGIRQLYKEYNEQDTCSNYWINTNHRDAFALPQDEVRYWVYFSDAKRNEKILTEFHNARFNWNLAGGVYAEMLDRDLSKFDPIGVAPHTEYRDMMTELADKPVNDYIKEGYEQSIFPFDRSLVSSTELFHWLQDETKIRITREREVTAALELLNPKPIRKKGCPVREVGHNINVWIIRDHEKYKNLTSIELGMKYQGFYTDNRVEKVKNKSYDKYRNTGKGPLMPYKDLTEGSTRNVTKEGEVDVAANVREENARINTKLILKKKKTF